MNSVNPSSKVPFDDLDYDGELLYKYQGSLYTGVAFEDVPGKWYTEISYEDGMQTGLAREWRPSGELKSESECRYNVRHGESKTFYADGKMQMRKWYEYGILVRMEELDTEGRVVHEWEISPDDSLYPMLVEYRAVKRWPGGGGS